MRDLRTRWLTIRAVVLDYFPSCVDAIAVTLIVVCDRDGNPFVRQFLSSGSRSSVPAGKGQSSSGSTIWFNSRKKRTEKKNHQKCRCPMPTRRRGNRFRCGASSTLKTSATWRRPSTGIFITLSWRTEMSPTPEIITLHSLIPLRITWSQDGFEHSSITMRRTQK